MSDRLPGQRFEAQPASQFVPDDPQASPYLSSAAPPVTPQRYHSSAPVLGLVIGVAVVILAALIVFVGTRPQAGAPDAQGSSGPPTTATGPTPSPGWQGIVFEPNGSNTSGYWQVSQATWNGTAVTVTTTVSVDQGSLRFTFFALDGQMNDFYEPIGGTLEVGTVTAGKPQTGTVIFDLPHGNFTLYLATAAGSQITALVIQG